MRRSRGGPLLTLVIFITTSAIFMAVWTSLSKGFGGITEVCAIVSVVSALCTATAFYVWIGSVPRPAGFYRGVVFGRVWGVVAGGGVRGLVGVAGVVAGSRHRHLVEAWQADLFGDPDAAVAPSSRRRLGLAAGDVVAALRCRVDDATALACGCVDRLVGSWRGSVAVYVAPAAGAAVLVVAREGLFGLVANAENLTCIVLACFGAVKGLRAYRHVSAPKRPGPKKAAGPRSGAR